MMMMMMMMTPYQVWLKMVKQFRTYRPDKIGCADKMTDGLSDSKQKYKHGLNHFQKYQCTRRANAQLTRIQDHVSFVCQIIQLSVQFWEEHELAYHHKISHSGDGTLNPITNKVCCLAQQKFSPPPTHPLSDAASQSVIVSSNLFFSARQSIWFTRLHQHTKFGILTF